jgi:hypothetical protein
VLFLSPNCRFHHSRFLLFLTLPSPQTVHDNGYALNDIVTELSLLVSKLDLPDIVIGHIIDKLSTLEYRLSHGVSDKIQIGALVGAFTVARNMMQ